MENLIDDRAVTFRQTGNEAISRYQRFFSDTLNQYFTSGSITFMTPSGAFSAGGSQNAPIVVRVHDAAFFRKVVCHGNLGMGESYMAGDFSVDDGRLDEFLTTLLRGGLDRKLRGDVVFAMRYLGVRIANFVSGKSTNVQRHYDVGDDLFDNFLEDRFKVYSCGYAERPDDDIETLQQRKLDRVCQKLRLQPGQNLLDIGCGSGGLIIHAALTHGVTATGITNSRSHYERARTAIKAHGLTDRVNVIFGDFSEVSGQFDRVASIGMLEHVPPRQYGRYFRAIKRVLRPDGWALVHAIGLNAAVNRQDPFVQKYIFPGSDTPRLSAMAGIIESNDMAIIDVENIARHYAVTTRRWLEAFRRNKSRLDAARYDDVFKRMWEYYLACGVAVALAGDLAVYQVLFTNDYHADYSFQRI